LEFFLVISGIWNGLFELFFRIFKIVKFFFGFSNFFVLTCELRVRPFFFWMRFFRENDFYRFLFDAKWCFFCTFCRKFVHFSFFVIFTCYRLNEHTNRIVFFDFPKSTSKFFERNFYKFFYFEGNRVVFHAGTERELKERATKPFFFCFAWDLMRLIIF